MSEYSTWDESKGRIEDRFEHIEKTLDAISSNLGKLLWLVGTALITLLGHAIMTFIQMGGK